MKVLVIGEPPLFNELQEILGDSIVYEHYTTSEMIQDVIQADVVIDFTIDESPDNLAILMQHVQASVILVNVIKTSLAELVYYFGSLPPHIVGFNGMAGFINRSCWEVSHAGEALPAELSKLSLEFVRVEDRVGMVTPRVISMIINEAYYTVQEGTASREDIDLGMKLGTGYPYGPFEWAQKIGLANIYELLEALWEDTHEERYKICPLLKKEYMRL